jgi:hypothetical protein
LQLTITQAVAVAGHYVKYIYPSVSIAKDGFAKKEVLIAKDGCIGLFD